MGTFEGEIGKTNRMLLKRKKDIFELVGEGCARVIGELILNWQ